MDRLQADLKAMIAHVATLPKGPTTEQLMGKVKVQNALIQKDIVALPKRIKEMVQQAFLEMGWDGNRQRIVNVSLFTHAGLSHTLAELLNQLQNWSPAVTPTDAELADLSNACDRLWELDAHRLVPDVDYVLNLQQGKNSYDRYDAASQPLFTFVDEKALLRPTYAAFIALLDNYAAATGVTETVTAEEKAENLKFLNLVMDTQVMQYVHRYLLLRKKTKAADRDQFIHELDELWFGLYSRKARNDSSGFEHVFVGEIKEDTNEIVGFHNWIQIYLEERKSLRTKSGTFDYRGFIKPKRRALPSTKPRSLEQLVTIQFEWRGALKNVSSSLIGTSPEFELALYTLCFYCSPDECVVKLGPYKVNITSYTWPAQPRPGQKVYVATSFPSEVPLDEHEVGNCLCTHSCFCVWSPVPTLLAD
jgi:poly(U)-specific endoribonuclease